MTTPTPCCAHVHVWEPTSDLKDETLRNAYTYQISRVVSSKYPPDYIVQSQRNYIRGHPCGEGTSGAVCGEEIWDLFTRSDQDDDKESRLAEMCTGLEVTRFDLKIIGCLCRLICPPNQLKQDLILSILCTGRMASDECLFEIRRGEMAFNASLSGIALSNIIRPCCIRIGGWSRMESLTSSIRSLV
jgi:hypothetical protein